MEDFNEWILSQFPLRYLIPIRAQYNQLYDEDVLSDTTLMKMEPDSDEPGLLEESATLQLVPADEGHETPTNVSPRQSLHSRRKRRRLISDEQAQVDNTYNTNTYEEYGQDINDDNDSLTQYEKSLWVPVPESSSQEKQRCLLKQLQNDPKLCRLCGDTFCRDATYGDPHLISCSACGNYYHTFCIKQKPLKNETWKCYKCVGGQLPKLLAVGNSCTTLRCLVCNKPSKGEGRLEGRLIGPIGDIGDTSQKYIHENCAFYSQEAVKIHNHWYRLASTVRNSHQMKCSFCNRKGASVPCNFAKCRKTFHYGCVKKNECFTMQGDDGTQSLYCDSHYYRLRNCNPNSPPPLVVPDSPKYKKQKSHNADHDYASDVKDFQKLYG